MLRRKIPEGLADLPALGVSGSVEDDVVGQGPEDADPRSSLGVAPEARADRVPADVRPGPARPLADPREPDRRAARGPAVPGMGGGQTPPTELGRSPAVRPKRALATLEPEPGVGRRPVPPTRPEELAPAVSPRHGEE